MKKTAVSRPAFAGVLMLLCAAGLLIRRTFLKSPDLFNSYFPDIAWTMALYCTIGMLLNRGVRIHLPLALLGSYLVEYSQTLDYPLLNTIRANRFGALLLGNDFVWSDMICYTVGAVICAIAELAVCFVLRRRTPPEAIPAEAAAESPEAEAAELSEESGEETVDTTDALPEAAGEECPAEQTYESLPDE